MNNGGSSSKKTGGPAVMLADRQLRSGPEVDLGTGPASGLAGMRRLLGDLVAAGATFGPVPEQHPVEWARLTAPDAANAAAMADLALSASERRLHRESEQVYRLIAAGAAAACHGAESLGGTVVLRGLGRTDLPSLRGMVRAAEFSAATGIGRLYVPAADAVQVLPAADPAADTRPERARCLQAMGLTVAADELQVVDGPITPLDDAQSRLFALALDGSVPAVERIAAALTYCRLAFYAANWEGMALVAAGCLDAARALTRHDMSRLAEDAGAGLGSAGPDDEVQAIEFEPALLRHPGDITAYLLKVLGVQASYRSQHTEALRYFRSMRGVDDPVSTETRSQSHLYSALTLAKRQQQIPDAVAELEAGFELVRERHGEPASVRRERGWLHNLRGLTLFSQGRLVEALAHEKSALECVAGGVDASSVHLRVNLVSNISVLQESAGKYDQALATWLRLGQDGPDADPKLVKHHGYRTAGLQLRAGDVEAGIAGLSACLARCVDARDDFHEYEVAAELATLLLNRNRVQEASDLFDQAAAAATRIGDPVRMAIAALGRAASSGGPVGEQTVAGAMLTRTQPAAALTLVEGCRTGASVDTLLPAYRTKLNRPFDLVNI